MLQKSQSQMFIYLCDRLITIEIPGFAASFQGISCLGSDFYFFHYSSLHISVLKQLVSTKLIQVNQSNKFSYRCHVTLHIPFPILLFK